MSEAVEEILNSILEDLKPADPPRKKLEAKALFRLLNYCSPPAANVPLPEKPADLK
jgi:hypothetical protein